ncbi:50S ribosomal protein L37Ae [Candidatus Tiddalikarchaeum anstoanum]|nr:50S ribosomal protein L37Ae [Candidatus Tiddalikarchaeum anstoanum]
MAKTKKVGSTGRFGARYGLKIRRRVMDIEVLEKAKQHCPVCKTGNVKRISKGIFVCKKCNSKIAGRAYTLK